MQHTLPRSLRAAAGVAFVCVCLGLVSTPAAAGKIAWPGTGAFEACLDEIAEAWLNEKAEGVVNGDESVKTLDDTKVAMWTVEALKSCSAKGKPAHADNEAVFGKYMAHWRQHLYDMAAVIRAKGGSD